MGAVYVLPPKDTVVPFGQFKLTVNVLLQVVLVSSNGQPSDLVVDVNSPHTVIKDESQHIQHRGLNSPQHGSRSINGTPTSTHSSLLADGSNTGPIELIASSDGGLKPAMYTTQIFTHGSASGSPSPIPYSDHNAQYTQSALNGSVASSYVTGGLSNNGASSVRTGNGAVTAAFTVADPYYREYFTTVTSGAGTPEPVYATQLRQNQLGGYSDSAEGSNAVATASFVERYVRQSSAYHSKGVIAAAGLTVDLPSPDSGIGADAITPRDQNALQQVWPALGTYNLSIISFPNNNKTFRIACPAPLFTVLRLHRALSVQLRSFGSRYIRRAACS